MTACLRFYQRWLSPMARLLGAQCRFSPSCSAYAAEVFAHLPWHRAAWLTLRRLGCCHSWYIAKE